MSNTTSSTTKGGDENSFNTSESRETMLDSLTPVDTLIEDEAENDSIPPNRYTITSYGADYPVDGLVKRIQRGDIFIPSFQRSYVWKLEQASRFIESLLMGLPVPGIFLAKEADTNKLIVIDGQQRLKTLQFFYGGRFEPRDKPFELKKVAEQFLGKTYETLSAVDRRMLDDAILPATIVRQEQPEDTNPQQSSIYHIFERLNTGGTKLEPQEIRACVNYGDFNKCLNQINQNLSWQKIFQGRENVEIPNKTKRMKDQELILRFLSLHFELNAYKSSMKDFLTKFMYENRDLSKYSGKQIESIFIPTIELVYTSIGLKAFRPRRGLNAAVFDAVMVGIANRLEKGNVTSINSLKVSYEKLLGDRKFLNVSIKSRHISNIENVKKRVRLAIAAFKDVP